MDDIDPTDAQIERLRSFGQSSGRTPEIRKQRGFDRALIVEFAHGKLALICADGTTEWDKMIQRKR